MALTIGLAYNSSELITAVKSYLEKAQGMFMTIKKFYDIGPWCASFFQVSGKIVGQISQVLDLLGPRGKKEIYHLHQPNMVSNYDKVFLWGQGKIT